MRTGSPRRIIPAAVAVALTLALAACGGDDASTTDTSSADTTTPDTTPDTTTPDTGAAPTTVATTEAPDTTGALTTPAPSTEAPTTTGDDGVVRISVTVGVDSSPDRVEEVPLGSTVELTMVNPDAEDEFHLHGYDIGDESIVPAGTPKLITLTATQAGDFELESHLTEEVYLVLRVA